MQQLEVWRPCAELGALGALFDPEVGGYGVGPAEIAAVFGGHVALGWAA